MYKIGVRYSEFCENNYKLHKTGHRNRKVPEKPDRCFMAFNSDLIYFVTDRYGSRTLFRTVGTH